MSTGLSIERLRREGEEFMQELSREYFEAHAGLKASAELQPVYAKHREILGRDALELTRENFLASAEGSEERRSARLLLDWQARGRATRSSGSTTGVRSRISARRSNWPTAPTSASARRSSGRAARWCRRSSLR